MHQSLDVKKNNHLAIVHKSLRLHRAAAATQTRRLLKAGRLKKARKVGDEAIEVALEAVLDIKDTVIRVNAVRLMVRAAPKGIRT
jgi:phosphoribosyl-ATP pyrophosphohydrolase